MRLYILTLCGLLSLNVFSQSANEVQLPNVIPPSPTPFELTKYGNIELNESSGEIAASIDLYNYKAGRLTLPISMSYAGAGVKVDQLCSWTGINWNLRAGGVISRTVRDRTDESSTRRFYTQAQLVNLSTTTAGIENLTTMPNDGYDTEVDIFSFNFAGYSGSFYLDQNLLPKLANYNQELKIEFITSPIQDVDSQQILITDPNGVKYYFGGTAGTERTRLDLSGTSFNTLQNPITAYYLVKIVNPLLDEINLTYLQETSDYNVKIGTNESYKKIYKDDLPGYPTFLEFYSGLSTSRTKTYNGKYLSKITCNRSNEEIHFLSTEYGNEDYHRILNNIKITQNKGNNVYADFKNYSLQYLFKNGAANSTRFFLQTLTSLNGNNIKDQQHSFEYNNPNDMPDRLSFSKDNLGYFNGKSNSSGLPITNHETFQNVGGINLADRSPNFLKAVTGSLAKIKYPTSGTTTFDYEGIPAKEYNYTVKSISVYNDLSTLYPSAYPVPDTQLIASHYAGSGANETINLDQNVVFKIHATAQGSLNNQYKVRITVKEAEDMAPEQTQSFDLAYQVYSYDKEFTFNFLKYGTYNIKVELVVPYGSTSAPVDVDVDYKYISDIKVVEGVGVRVKRIKNDPITGPGMIKRYYYNKVNDINKTDDIPFINDFYGPNIESLEYTKYEVRSPGGVGAWPYPILTREYTLFSESVRDILPDNQKTYQYVTTSFGGDNFENGGLQKTYRSISAQNPTNAFNFYPPDQQNNVIKFSGSSTENKDMYNGEVVEELTFVKDNGVLKMNKKSSSSFLEESPDFIMNLNIKKIFDNVVGLTSQTPTEALQRIYHLYFGLYKTFVNKKQLQSQVNIDYIDAVPVTNLANAASYKQVSTTTDYSYQTGLVGLPVIIKTTSSTGDVLKTENQYSTALGHVSRHQLSEIATTSTYNNTTLLSTKKTIYSDFGTRYLPAKIQTSKGNGALEDRVTFLLYDDKGNPIELYKTDGTHIAYLWGYNKTLPIAKFENTTYDNIPSIDIVQTASDSGNEANLITALNTMRNDPRFTNNIMVTTITYQPLIGISTITDPKGDKTTYTYDSFGRLEFVKDNAGKILSENQYNYKP
ncbi:RHS repeat domain-containing protein [Flavobacterium sp. JAS]|uniref:RHS repeat domain-containing protein n=1 Tax=Flavobacterium sp. JAS TaxID=2897329 RepID=UPI001E38C075|nr:RHS repeat domain-containing protein [Flavobacterium sp. JAS]MCD0472580.1 RHS repeat protein [Flavobacterium sp. JAS]